MARGNAEKWMPRVPPKLQKFITLDNVGGVKYDVAGWDDDVPSGLRRPNQ